MLTQGATLGAPAPHCGRIARRQASSGPSSARTQSRVTCQATFGGSQPGPQRVREQSPSRIQAVAAPGLDRPQLQQQQQLKTAVSLLEQHLEATEAYLQDPRTRSSNNTTTLELSRAHAERLFQLEAAAAALQEASAARLHTRRSAVPAADGSGLLPSADEAEQEEEAVAAQEAEQQRQQRGQAEQQRRERRQRSAAAASTSGRAAQPKQ